MRRLHPFSVFTVLLFLLSIPTLTWSQMEVTNAPPITPENLITNIFLGDGLEVINVTFDGDPQAVGFFNHGTDAIGIERGIIMTTGRAVSAGVNVGAEATGNDFASNATTSTASDADLTSIAAPNAVQDVIKYSITFIPVSDTLRFKYVWASEEYPEYACSSFNDVFGFFISGPGFNGPYENNGENIALIPGTTLPVTINNINSGAVGGNGMLSNCTPPIGSLAFFQFYNNNNFTTSQPSYDGYTTVLVAEAVVTPCQEYTIKLVIADAGDTAFDSGVFLEAKSFGTGSLEVEATTVSLDGSVVEGCGDGVLTFSLPNVVENDFLIDFIIFGTAINGVDYELMPDTVYIPAGSSSVSIPIIAFEDGIDELPETLLIDIQRDPCNRDTISIIIRDNPLIPIDLGDDILLCRDTVQLDATIDIPLPEAPTFSNTTPLLIPSFNIPVFSDIVVSGVVPLTLGPDVIKSICIDSLEHRWIDDIDIYLISPDGQFLELTTDNGGNGGSPALGIDNYLNTCFTVDATTAINAPGPFAPPEAVPFTGDFQPEGVWSDLWDSDHRSNGTWRLQIIDDTQNLDGTLFSWTICFNPTYEITYEWTPAAGLSCTDCPDPLAFPDTTTTYTVVATDSYGCSETAEITIEVKGPEAELVTTNVSCFGEMDGDVQITVLDGIPPFTFDLNGVTNGTGSFNNLAIGDYEVIISGGSECQSSVFFTIAQESPPNVSFVLSEVSCNGGSDGQATVEITNGIGPFTFNWSNGESDSLAINMSEGIQTLILTDAAGCGSLHEFEVNEPSLFTAQADSLGVGCNGEASGSAVAIGSGGTAPYTYLWDTNAADQTTDIATNLSTGTYFVTLTDNKNCTTIANTEVVESPAIALQTSVDSTECFGSMDGSAVVTPSGGEGAFTYLWQAVGNTTVLGTDSTITGLTSGAYEIIVTDEAGCIDTAFVDIFSPEELFLEAISALVLCFGNNDGTVNLTVLGGTTPYSFTWDDGGAATMTRTDLTAGTHFVTVTDAHDCTIELSMSVNTPSAIEATYTFTDPDCFDGDNGSIAVLPAGGIPTYTFLWEDGQTTSLAENLTAGETYITITDNNDCPFIDTLQLENPVELEVSLSAEDPGCNGEATGNASLETTGGTGDLTFLWNNTAETSTIDDLPAGNYSVTITDENNCTVEASIELNEPVILATTSSATLVDCDGEDGTASVNPTGGTTPYTYAWNDGNSQTTSTATELVEATYIVTITDAKGCTITETVAVGAISQISLSHTFENISCFGGNDGFINVTVNGGNGNYTYSWTPVGLPNSGNISSLAAQDYQLLVTDELGCTHTLDVSLTQPTEVAISSTAEDITCNNGIDGHIDLTVNGGVAPYTYLWSNAAITKDVADLSVGNYAVSITDANGCQHIRTFELTAPEAIRFQFETVNLECFGDLGGAAKAEITGGVPNYTYLWSTGNTENELENLSGGMYILQITDAEGCSKKDSVFVQEPFPLSADIGVEDVSCYGGRDGLISTEAIGGTSPYQYSLDNENYNGSTVQIGLIADEYNLFIRDANGCLYFETAILVEEPAAIDVNLGPDQTIVYGETIQMTPTFGTSTFPVIYEWWPSDTSLLSCLDCETPIVTTDHQVSLSLQVTDENGCIGEDLITIYIEKDFEIYVPTGFTPNGDGINDRLLVHGKPDVTINYFRVYDRWGELLLEETDFDVNTTTVGWDGTFRGENLQPGVYIWHLEATLPDGNSTQMTGSTTLIR